MELTSAPGAALVTEQPESILPFELEILRRAKNYQRWIADTVTPHLGTRILEIGSGIGNMSRWLPVRDLLVLSEADPLMFPLLAKTVSETFHGDPKVILEKVELNTEYVDRLASHQIDTVISFNVLEHVTDDQQMMIDLHELLRKSSIQQAKRLITFVPAHPWAYGSIDQSYGHFRRYTVDDFKRFARAQGFKGRMEWQYFNLTGLPSWFVLNRVLKRRQLGLGSVAIFEKLCPWIRGLDDFLHVKLRLPLGQSLLVVQTLDES